MSPSKYWASALPALPAALSSSIALLNCSVRSAARAGSRGSFGLTCLAGAAAADRPMMPQSPRAERGDPTGAFAAHSHHAVPYLVSTSMPIERRKSFGRMPPALTITASLRTFDSCPGMLQAAPPRVESRGPAN